ncbi:MAG: hypothetical protein PHE88_05040 [Elusimicrobia bacterium]|nr:hypothetical protein [Elusimicrobiota bacterium]
MKNKFYRFFLFLISYFLLLASFHYAEQEINITSENIEYDRINKKAIYSDNVRLKVGDTSLICKSAEVNIDKRELFLEKVFFTTCDAENPHYRYYANKVHVIINQKMTALNVVFYLDDVPSGELPYYYKSLKEKKLRVEFKHGYSQRDNYFSKGFIGYPISNAVYGKLYLDYFTYKGWGTGTEFNYRVPGKVEGSVYGYHIKEQDTLLERWNARIYHWQDLSHNWTARINSNMASDQSFNNFYTKDWIRIYGDLNSSVAFTRNTNQSSTNILFSRLDVFSLKENKYILTGMSVPSLSYALRQTKIKNLPLYYGFGANLLRAWSRVPDYYLTTGDSNFDLTSPLRITRSVTLTPSAGYVVYWQDRKTKLDLKDTFRNVYRTDVNLSIRSFYFLNHEFGHHFEQELYKKKDEYKGVLVNKLRTTQSIYLDNMTIRLWTGLDIRQRPYERIKYFVNRWDGVTSELDYSPYKFWNIYYKNDYNVLYEKPNSVQFSSNIKFREKDNIYLRNDVSYNRATPDSLTFLGEMGIRPTRNWQFAYKMQTTFKNDIYNVQYYERAINIYRDLHCWEIDFSYVDRAPLVPTISRSNNYEFWFNIRIKPSSREKKNEQYEDEIERKWYPWR